MANFDNIDDILNEHVPAEQLTEVRRVLYGAPVETIEVTDAAKAMATADSFEIKAYKVPCPAEQMRPARLVRIGAVQNSIVLPTTAPLLDQYEAIKNKVAKIIAAAAEMGVNVLCLQEAWTCPFFFCTREKAPWTELAEDAETGRSTLFLKELAAKYNMVIISPILERDTAHSETLWNTAVVIGNHGNYIGKSRKNHIPRVGDFNESTYYMEGDSGHPVFQTQFGKIAINICYGRHHPLNWQMFALNGAEIIFNPSATVGALSEPMWSIEARNAAIANTVYTVAINRVGTEEYPNEFTSANGKPAHKDFGNFYGSSYVACPNASRTPGLSRNQDGLLVTEVDLNMQRQVRDKWTLQMTARIPLYAESFTRVARADFKQQIINDKLVE